MKTIQLTQGKETFVDDEDFEWLSRWKWNANIIHDNWYAVRVDGKNSIYMHREIMKTPKDMETDHRFGDSLNNQKYNLRNSTRKQNGRNRRPQRDCSSEYKGVSWDKSRCRWQSHIKIDYISKFLGRFDIEKDAARAYNDAAIKYFGEFARLNKF